MAPHTHSEKFSERWQRRKLQATGSSYNCKTVILSLANCKIGGKIVNYTHFAQIYLGENPSMVINIRNGNSL